MHSFSWRSFHTQEEVTMNYLRSNPQILSSEHLASDRQLQIILSLGSRLHKHLSTSSASAVI